VRNELDNGPAIFSRPTKRAQLAITRAGIESAIDIPARDRLVPSDHPEDPPAFPFSSRFETMRNTVTLTGANVSCSSVVSAVNDAR